MNWTDLPVVSTVSAAGPEDRMFDSLLLLGPVLIAVIAVLGRSVVTEALAGVYIAVFVASVAYHAVE